MKIILSPAKNMNEEGAALEVKTKPAFPEQTETLMARLKKMSRKDLQAMWDVSDKLTDKNVKAIKRFDSDNVGVPALELFDGLAYKYVKAEVFTEKEWAYVQKHLRIISGLYGLIRPLDGIQPYRLEMGTKIKVKADGEHYDNLYDFWGTRLADALAEDDDVIVNLASKEYSKAVTDHLPDSVRLITINFGEITKDKNGKKKFKSYGTKAKMARGMMVRYMAEHQIEDVEAIKKFDEEGYRFDPASSDDDNWNFLD